MRTFLTLRLGLALIALLVWCSGCDRASAPPAPLAVEQIPAALQQAFSKGKPEVNALVGEIVAAVQAQDYSKAFLALQNLSALSGLKKEQQSVAARAALTVNNLLQSAQAKGDTQAAETLKAYRVNK